MNELKKLRATTRSLWSARNDGRGAVAPFFCKKMAGLISESPATASKSQAEFKLALLNISVSSFLYVAPPAVFRMGIRCHTVGSHNVAVGHR